jgi:hypothetical protein
VLDQRQLAADLDRDPVGHRAVGFARHPEALERAAWIAATCRFSLDELTYTYPDEAEGGGCRWRPAWRSRENPAASMVRPRRMQVTTSCIIRFGTRLSCGLTRRFGVNDHLRLAAVAAAARTARVRSRENPAASMVRPRRMQVTTSCIIRRPGSW